MMKNFLRLSVVGVLFSAQLVWAAGETAAIGSAPEAAEASMTTTSATPLTEEQIPLNVDMAKKASEAATGSTRLFMTAFILLVIMGGTYYMVRKYKLSNSINKSNTKIKVLSQHYLGPKKSLAIIHVAGESILIGITDSNVSMIKSLSLIDDEVPAELPQNFSDTMQAKTERPAGATARAVTVDELEEEFSFSGVKDSVSKKLKSMRSLS